jgi:hypothetical protein
MMIFIVTRVWGELDETSNQATKKQESINDQSLHINKDVYVVVVHDKYVKGTILYVE